MKYQRALILTMLVWGFSAAGFDQWNFETQQILRPRGQYYDLATDEDVLYLACKRGVEIYSIANPEDPQLIGYFPTDGLANGVAVNHPYIYVGDVYGFSIWDISDPSSPLRLSGFKRAYDEGYQERLLYRDGLVYVAAYNNGLQIIDVSDPSHPYILSEADTPAYAWDLAVYENAMFIMDFFSMEIIDISRSDAPLNRTSYDAMFAGGIAIQQNLAYLAYIDGLRVLDIRNPFAPQLVAEPGPTGSGAAESVSVSGDYAFLAHSSYVEIYDVSIPSDPVQEGFYYPPGHPRKVWVYDHYVYTILDDSGFHIADISNPASPATVRHIDPSVWGSRKDTLVSGDYLYLSDWNRGLVIYDISNDDAIMELASYSTPGSLNEVCIDGNRAYLSCYSEIQILDITDHGAPVFLGSYKTTGNSWSVSVVGNRAYLCDLYSFQILDVTNPASIKKVGSLLLSKDGVPLRSVIRNTAAFIADGYGGLKIVDIAHPEIPAVLNTYPSDGSKNYSSLFLKDNYLYAMDSGDGLDVLDITNPVTPVLVSNYDFNDISAAGFTWHNNIVYAALGTSGIQAVDYTNPVSPKLVGRADTPGESLGIATDGTRVFVADDFDLVLLRIGSLGADPQLPQTSINTGNNSLLDEVKTAAITGTAFDQHSGVRYVEISIDDGLTWTPAKGQENWSYCMKGLDPGRYTVNARAVDWASQAGNPVSIEVTWAPARPHILIAGYETTYASGSNPEFKLSALVTDPYEPAYIKNVAINNPEGSMTNTFLDYQAQGSGILYFSYTGSVNNPASGDTLYYLTSHDVFTNPSMKWPYLVVSDN